MLTAQNATLKLVRRALPALLLAATFAVGGRPARADDAVQLSITMKDRVFDPAELHAPPGKQIVIYVKNLNSIVTEFESSDCISRRSFRSAARVWFTCGRSSRAATISSTISTMRRRAFWWCSEMRVPCLRHC